MPLTHAAGNPTSDATVAAPGDPASSISTAASQMAAATPSLGAPAPAAPPATAAAASASLPTVPLAASEQVAVTLRQAVKDGNDQIQIQLEPADLGAVQVKLNINHDGKVTVVVSADRSDTLNMLKQDAGGLTQALRDAGLQTDSSSLSFNLRGGHQFNQQAQGSGTGFAGNATVSDDDAALAAPPTRALRAHSGSLDIQV